MTLFLWNVSHKYVNLSLILTPPKPLFQRHICVASSARKLFHKLHIRSQLCTCICIERKFHHNNESTVGRDGCCGNATQLLIDQLIPESYLQLEDAVQKIAQQYQDLQKPPVLTAQEFRYTHT